MTDLSEHEGPVFHYRPLLDFPLSAHRVCRPGRRGEGEELNSLAEVCRGLVPPGQVGGLPAVNRLVVGSNPTRGANRTRYFSIT